MLDIILRYKPIVDDIKNNKYKRILEVGSDDYGIAPFLDLGHKITLFGINFRRKSLKKVFYKTGSVLKLPFKDNAFECVVSLDMLEHIPPKLRNKAISELMRVTGKKLYLGFPCDIAAQKRDKTFFRLVSRFKGSPYFKYIEEHIKNGLPSSKSIYRNLETYSPKRIQIVKNLNAKIEIYLVILSNLDFVPILILQKLLDKISIDILPFAFRFFMFGFGWLSKPFSYGDCYRKIFFINKDTKTAPV